MFRIDSLNKKETEMVSNCVGFRPSVVVMLQPESVYNKVVVDMRESHLALDCAVADELAARAEEVGEAVADHAPGPRAAAAPLHTPGL